MAKYHNMARYMDFLPRRVIKSQPKKSVDGKTPAPQTSRRMRQKLVWPHQNRLGHPKWWLPDFFHEKLQETNGEALLYFCQQASFWGLFRGGRAGWFRLGRRAKLTGKPFSYPLFWRIHVNFPGSFSVGSMKLHLTFKAAFRIYFLFFFGLLQ